MQLREYDHGGLTFLPPPIDLFTPQQVSCLPGTGHKRRKICGATAATPAVRPSAVAIYLQRLPVWQLQFAWRSTAWEERCVATPQRRVRRLRTDFATDWTLDSPDMLEP